MLQYSSFQQTLWWYFLVFLCALIGRIFNDRNFYKKLKKPSWSPPPWLFSIWFLLYILQAQSSYFVQVELSEWGVELWIYIVFLIVSTSWTFFFFYIKNITLSLIVIGFSLILCIVVNIFYFATCLLSGFLFLPTTLWIAFASLLNLMILLYNTENNKENTESYTLNNKHTNKLQYVSKNIIDMEVV